MIGTCARPSVELLGAKPSTHWFTAHSNENPGLSSCDCNPTEESWRRAQRRLEAQLDDGHRRVAHRGCGGCEAVCGERPHPLVRVGLGGVQEEDGVARVWRACLVCDVDDQVVALRLVVVGRLVGWLLVSS